MDNPPENTALIKVNTGLERVNKQIAITSKLLQAIDPILIPYRKKDKWGFCTPDKKIVIECVYDNVKQFQGGRAIVIVNKKWGIINRNCQKIVDCIYDRIENLEYDLYRIELDNKWGIIDKAGHQLIPIEYDYIFNFISGFARISLNGKCGLIDKDGKQIIPCNYDSIPNSKFKEGMCLVTANDKYGYVTEDGKEIVPCSYYYGEDYADGFALVLKIENGNDIIKTFIDILGKELARYSRVQSFYKGYAPVGTDNSWGFIDTTGTQIVPFIYDDYCVDGYLNPSLIGAETAKITNGKLIFLNASGKEFIPSLGLYHKIDKKHVAFSEGLTIKINYTTNKYGFMDERRSEKISCIYDEVKLFSEGLAAVKINDKWGVIDKSGKQISSFKYDDITGYMNGFAKFKLNNQWGIIDNNGKEIFQYLFDFNHHLGFSSIFFLSPQIQDSVLKVVLNGKVGYMGLKGEKYWED